MLESSNSIDHNNAKLTYDYIQYCLDTDKKGVESLERKLTTLLASSGILLRLSMDLPSVSTYLELLKIGVNLCILISLISCLIGLAPKIVGTRVRPEETIDDDHYGMTDEEMRLFISRERVEASKKINEKFRQMQCLLSLSYLFIGVAGLFFAVSNILFSLTH